MTLLLHWDEQRYAEESASLRLVDIDDALIVGTDFSSPAATLGRMIEARRNGRLLALHPVLTDPLEPVIEQVAASIAISGEAEQYLQLCALRDGQLNVNGKPLIESASYDGGVLQAAQIALKLADILLFFTAAEKDRWSALIRRRLRSYAYLPVPRLHEAPATTGGVAVYAPHASQLQLAFVALALSQRHVRANVISSENSTAAIGAGTVIVPSWWRPARAASLSAAGYRVVAPLPGAPDERCGCATYRQDDAFSLGAAIDAAQSESGCGLHASANGVDARAAIESARAPMVQGPRISVIVRTFDRPKLLGRALRSIAAQRYGDIEIVVVNNGGSDVQAIVEAASSGRPYRYVHLDERLHISGASNRGARTATGSYIAYLDDDDLLYPDHAALTVAALERTGADVAYTNCLAEYARMDGDEKHLIGFQLFRDRDFDPTLLMADNFAPIHSIVHRCDLFERFGFFDEELAVQDDWEMWLRAARAGARFVHVDRITCEYSWRHDPARGNMTLTHQQQFSETYGKITSRYAAQAGGIPAVKAMQAQTLAILSERARMLAAYGNGQAEQAMKIMAQNTVASDVPADPFE